MRVPRSLVPFALAACGLGLASPARALPPGFTLQVVHSGVNFPTTLRFAPDGRLFFTELSGRVAYYPSLGSTSSVTWATLDVAIGGERGVLGLAVHPDYPDSPYVYVVYSNVNPLEDRLVRFVDFLGEGKSPAVLIAHPADQDYHHGGRVAFGPDGQIYLTYGDQLNLAAAQTIGDPRGKMFRVGRGGKPSPGNPWGPTDAACLLGIRNVFGLCFDPVDGTGYFTENGPDCDDEINLLSLGANFGWGPDDFCGGSPPYARLPLASFTPTIAPTGCAVYRGGVYPSRWDGSLFFGGWNSGFLYRTRFVAGRPDLVDTLDVFADLGEGVLDVTVGPDGFLWVATPTRIVRITYAPVVGVGPSNAGALGPSLRLSPNPFRADVAFDVENAPAGSQLEVIDLQGRRVASWGASQNRRLHWDGRDQRGDRAPPGVYLVRLRGGDVSLTRRLIRLGG